MTINNAILPMPPYKWQEKVWTEFVANAKNSRLPHALLLSGSQGIGLEHLALAMGQYLLCQSPMDAIACGRCKNCLLMSSGNHPDLVYVSPEDIGKQIKVDDIRALSEFVAKTAQQGARKVIVIEPADALNMNAANALLKNLEEPAGDTIFILVSSSLSRVLPTVRSRCAKVPLPLPDKKLAIEWLESLHIDSPSSLLHAVGGAPLKAKEWYDSDFLAERGKLIKSLQALSLGHTSPIDVAKTWTKTEPLVILSCMQSWLEEMIRYKSGSGILGECEPFLDVLEPLEAKLLFRLHDNFIKKGSLLRGSSNLNQALVLEEMMLDWHAVLRYRNSPKKHASLV